MRVLCINNVGRTILSDGKVMRFFFWVPRSIIWTNREWSLALHTVFAVVSIRFEAASAFLSDGSFNFLLYHFCFSLVWLPSVWYVNKTVFFSLCDSICIALHCIHTCSHTVHCTVCNVRSLDGLHARHAHTGAKHKHIRLARQHQAAAANNSKQHTNITYTYSRYQEYTTAAGKLSNTKENVCLFFDYI